jgi:hypothetical protein
MHFQTNRWMTTLVLLSFFAIIAYAGTARAVQAAQNVFVTNTSSAPVPTTITNVPSVRVINSAPSPVITKDIQNPASQPFIKFFDTPIASGVNFAIQSFTASAHARIVFTHVSTFSNVGTAAGADDGVGAFGVDVTTRQLVHTGSWAFLPKKSESYPGMAASNDQTTIVLNPGDKMQLEVTRYGTSAALRAFATFSGYYVYVP